MIRRRMPPGATACLASPERTTGSRVRTTPWKINSRCAEGDRRVGVVDFPSLA